MKSTLPKFWQLIVLTLTLSQSGIASTTKPDSSSFSPAAHVIIQDFQHSVDGGLSVLKSPLFFSLADWGQVGLVTGSTGLLMLADRGIQKFALQHHNSFNDNLFNADSYQGNEGSLYLGLALYGAGLLTRKTKVREMGLRATQAFVYSGTITAALKVLIGRRRPYAGESHLFFKPFQFSENDYVSLPSGHTTVSFAVSTVLAKSIDNPYWKLFWYGSAGLVGASRIYHNKHWVSDVFLGSIIGYQTGAFVSHSDQKNYSHHSWRARIQPWVGINSIGVSLHL